MKVDAPGLITAVQQLVTAAAGVQGSAVPHPPLAADAASVGAAERLTSAGGELAAAFGGHVTGLLSSLETLLGVAVSFTVTDESVATSLKGLQGGASSSSPGSVAPPAPAITPDVRPPLPPPVGGQPEVLSASVHAGDPGAGEPFQAAWRTAGTTAQDASAAIRYVAGNLPEHLDTQTTTPAVTHHLLGYADGLDSLAGRAFKLSSQATEHAATQVQARASVPSPEQFAAANSRVEALRAANAASGGRYAAPYAAALADKQKLNQKATTGYGDYHAATDTGTAGDEGGSPDGTDPTTGAPGALGLDPNDPNNPLSPEGAGDMSSMLPQMIPTVLGAAGGLVGGLVGAVTKVPQELMQAGAQAAQAASQGLSQLAQPKMDSGEPSGGNPDSSAGGDPGDLGGAGGGGGDVPTTPAGGDGAPMVAPSTGAPPTPAIAPVGATGDPAAAQGGAGMGGMPMGGMPMGGMGGAGGGAGKDGKSGPTRKVTVKNVPHTEDVTGHVETNRLSVAAANTKSTAPPEPPDNDPTDFDSVVSTSIRRQIVTRPPKEPT
ncbi:hypothetical protein [Mycolicibacterium sp. CBMA 226]|uniref:hypothetical protein n=1 Tax=Mycolicibacterium sp. CBMA 226 TaxID=2606611 RepID=UPI0012DDFDBD|nr:hypothetical protein [Mycolicibacterium sp. CBMA 226]MUL78746.1 hypothetical protein [Mycolicibacterium sp. CBMA 226]QGW61038.1 hypothetical protein ICEMyc226_00006 [Mycolicibacterium sp.]